MDSRLEQAILEQLGFEELNEEAKQTLADVCRGGGNSGWSGFTYSAELLDFYKANRGLIIEELKSQADDFGVGFLEMILGFNCLKGNELSVDEIGEIVFGKNYDHDSATLVIDALGWAVLETLAFNNDR